MNESKLIACEDLGVLFRCIKHNENKYISRELLVIKVNKENKGYIKGLALNFKDGQIYELINNSGTHYDSLDGKKHPIILHIHRNILDLPVKSDVDLETNQIFDKVLSDVSVPIRDLLKLQKKISKNDSIIHKYEVNKEIQEVKNKETSEKIREVYDFFNNYSVPKDKNIVYYKEK